MSNQALQRLLRAGPASSPVSRPGDLHEQEAERIAARVGDLPGGLAALQALFEARSGVNLGGVRIHTDARAAALAVAFNARAFTFGNDIVFGAGAYEPQTAAGRRLLAHELTHVAQQSRDVSAHGPHVGLVSAVPAPRIMRVEGGGAAAATKPKISYKAAKKRNLYFASNRILGWETKLGGVVGGAYGTWADLWTAGKFDEFADAVAAYQVGLGWSGKNVNGVLDLATWAAIAGMGEAMAGIVDVVGADSKRLCYEAAAERIRRGYRLAAGEEFSLPEDATLDTFRVILRSIPGRMLDIEERYRGTGAAGALEYVGLGTLVPEADIWTGALRPGAAMQVWRYRGAYDLLRAGVITKKGKTRRITGEDANFYGTAFVFVRYDTETFERMLVRHFGWTEWVSRRNFDVWVAANVNEGEAE